MERGSARRRERLQIVSSPEASAAVESTARGVAGVTEVTDFLLLPEEGYQRLRPGQR